MAKDETSWKVVRIRQREADIIRQVADKYDERFIDALYRVVNYYRDNEMLGVTSPGKQPSPASQAQSISIDQDNDTEVDVTNLDLSQFLFE